MPLCWQVVVVVALERCPTTDKKERCGSKETPLSFTSSEASWQQGVSEPFGLPPDTGGPTCTLFSSRIWVNRSEEERWSLLMHQISSGSCLGWRTSCTSCPKCVAAYSRELIRYSRATSFHSS